MAVLEKIRERTISILIIVGLALFAFVVNPEDIMRFLNNSRSTESFSSVNGEEIDQVEYNNFIDNLNLPNDKEYSHTSAWNFLVNQKLIDKSSSDIGLTVTPEEIYELSTGSTDKRNISSKFKSLIEDSYKKSIEENQKDPNYPLDTAFTKVVARNPDGSEVREFSGEKVKKFLSSRSQWPAENEKSFSSIEDEMSKERLFQKYQTLIEKGMYTTNFTTRNERTQNAKVQYVSISYDNPEIGEVNVTDEEIEEYYHNNITDFQNEKESRNIEYVTFTPSPSLEDRNKLEEKMITIANNDSLLDAACKPPRAYDVQKIRPNYLDESGLSEFDPIFTKLITEKLGTVEGPYEFNGGYRLAKLTNSMMRPDSIFARHILLKKENFTNDSATTILKDLKKQVINGADFSQLATEKSEGPSSTKGGEFGWFVEGQMVPEFNDVCFTSKVGDLKIVTTKFGVHLIQIDSMTKLIPKYEISYFDRELDVSDETIQDYYSQAGHLIQIADDQGLVRKSSKSKNKLLQYWWILLDIGIIFILFYFIYIKKKNIRRFVPYAVLLAILATVYGLYFDSKSEEDITILKDNMQESVFKSLALSDTNDYEYYEETNIDNMTFNISPSLQGSREIVKWIFDVNTNVGDVSKIPYSINGKDFVVVSLSAINHKGDQKLERDNDTWIQIKDLIKNEKKFDIISSRLSTISELKDAASTFNTEIETVEKVNFASNNINDISAGDDYLLVQNFIGMVDALDEGESSGLIKGNNSACLLSIVSKDPILDSKEEVMEVVVTDQEKIYDINNDGKLNKEEQKQLAWNEYILKTLKDNSEIVDNRYNFY